MIELLIFSIVKIKPDITFTILITSCDVKNPSHQYTKVIKIILKYIKSSKYNKIIYNS